MQGGIEQAREIRQSYTVMGRETYLSIPRSTVKEIIVKRSEELLRLNHSVIRRVIGIMTNHYRLKNHLYIIGIAINPISACESEQETGAIIF